MPFTPFAGFELANGHTPPIRLSATDVSRHLRIVVDDCAAAEPRRWRLTEKGAAMFSASNIELLVAMQYAVEEP
jgi:hypothetical protein